MVVLLGSFACNAGRILPYRRPSGTYGDNRVRGEGAHGVGGKKEGKEEKIKSFSNGASRSSTTLVFGMMTDVDGGDDANGVISEELELKNNNTGTTAFLFPDFTDPQHEDTVLSQTSRW